MKKIYVICPGGAVTGGPELLHQLVHGLNERGQDAAIVYYPFDKIFTIPDAYKHYNLQVEKYNSVITSSVVVLPEVITGYSRFFKKSEVYIWWLSVDNYFNAKSTGVNRIIKDIIGPVIGKMNQIELKNMGAFKHLTQSEYAAQFLKQYDYESNMLSDYLNKEHFSKVFNVDNKKDIICYNPKKGYEITCRLIELNPELNFVPIQNMTSKEVTELLSKAKVYIDFGEHPGKDRIPREAAMAGCIVITGMKGSAKNSIDIPIPSKYKHDESKDCFFDDVSSILKISLIEYDSLINDFLSYRDSIKDEERKFNHEIDLLVNKLR